MTIEQKLRIKPLSLGSMRLRDENLKRLHAFRQKSPDEKPEPTPRDRVADYKPAPLGVSLLDLAEPAPPKPKAASFSRIA